MPDKGFWEDEHWQYVLLSVFASMDGLREGFKKKEKKGRIYPSGLAAWGQPGSIIQPKKKCFEEKNTKMIRMI